MTFIFVSFFPENPIRSRFIPQGRSNSTRWVGRHCRFLLDEHSVSKNCFFWKLAVIFTIFAFNKTRQCVGWCQTTQRIIKWILFKWKWEKSRRKRGKLSSRWPAEERSGNMCRAWYLYEKFPAAPTNARATAFISFFPFFRRQFSTILVSFFKNTSQTIFFPSYHDGKGCSETCIYCRSLPFVS